MKVIEIRNQAEWQSLRRGWETLLRDSASSTTFVTYEWATAWWRAYGRPGELRILAALDDAGVLRGIAPLRSQTVGRYGQTMPALTFIGDGSNDSDYLDFIVAPGCEEAVMEAFGLHWMDELKRGTVLLLNEIPESSPNLPFLRGLVAPNDMLVRESEVPCATVHLPHTWEEYLSTLRPRFRTKIRSVLRNLESRPEVRFGCCQSPEEVERLLPILFDLHARRWSQDGKPGVFRWDQKRDFYYALSPLLLERGWLRFSWLEWNGRVLACQYGFTYRDTYFHLQEGYEPSSEHWSVGLGLRAWSILEFLKVGLREYDFLGGVGRHKTDWGAKVKHSKNLLMGRANYKLVLFARGPEWEVRAKDAVRKIVPEQILSLRGARLQQRALAANAGIQNGQAAKAAGADWKQRATAQCYFHLGIAGLIRPLRERYQLSISGNGKSSKMSWSRRKEASGRILYYHRVNDEADPFFHAISTELFEQEMRFVARHYKVVSLAELLKHLESDSTETVVAVTFDDGYQDNYLNAFSILRRYAMPATIFLTTGSMDDGEPLWFEQLAGALKKTDREFVDLEVDFPRRFWTRTQSERLESNNQIFALLRSMTDSERRQWLPQILGELGLHDLGARKHKMLTWDQVRLMKNQGIDFGGHTVTHPFLSRMTRPQVAWEVCECKRRIEDELQIPIHHFAYPNGREEDFGKWNKEVISGAGYRAAVTTTWGMNYRSTDRLELRRGGPWETSPAMFAYKLDWYQLVND